MSEIKRKKRQRVISLMREDERELTRLIREAFPDVRFLRMRYWEKFDEESRTYIKNTPPSLYVPYLHGLDDPERSGYTLIWREPEGWVPDWTGPSEDGNFFIANEPRIQAAYYTSFVHPDPYPDGPEYLGTGNIWANWQSDDKEHAFFVNKLWRLTAKVATNVMILVDSDTKKPKTGEPGRFMNWAGHHALDWCRQDPTRTIDGNLRPVPEEPGKKKGA